MPPVKGDRASVSAAAQGKTVDWDNAGPAQRAIRLADVAAACGVSSPTASRALSGHGEVAASTRSAVLKAAHELGYHPSQQARGRPRSIRSNLIEVVLYGFDDPWGKEVVAGAQLAAHQLGYDVALVAQRGEPGDDWADRARERCSLGVIVGLIPPDSGMLETLRGAHIPIVLLDPQVRPPDGVPWVSGANRDGGQQAARHLLALGHRNFIVAAAKPAHRYGRLRIQGFLDAVRAVPDTRAEILNVGWTTASAFENVTERLLSFTQRPLAVFATNDVIAAGVARAANMLGLRIPQDISLVGFDDLPGARRMSTPLTTLRQPIREMAASAVHLLNGVIERDTLQAPNIDVPVTLIVRESTAHAR